MFSEGKMRIINAAKRVITARGIQGATMRVIAEEAGVSTGAIYHYYKSKEEILYDVMEVSLSASKQLVGEFNDGPQCANSIKKKTIANISDRLTKTEETKIQFYLSKEALMGNTELLEKFKQKYKSWLDDGTIVIDQMYNSPEFTHKRALASIILGAMDGIAFQNLFHREEKDLQEINELFDFFIKDGIPKLIEDFNEKKKSNT